MQRLVGRAFRLSLPSFRCLSTSSSSSSTPPHKVLHITSDAQLRTTIDQAPPAQLHLLQWSASWCGPCQRVTPHIQALSVAYPDVSFLHVDVDELPESAREAHIQQIPTFHFIRGNELLRTVKDSDHDLVEALLNEFGQKKTNAE